MKLMQNQKQPLANSRSQHIVTRSRKVGTNHVEHCTDKFDSDDMETIQFAMYNVVIECVQSIVNCVRFRVYTRYSKIVVDVRFCKDCSDDITVLAGNFATSYSFYTMKGQTKHFTIQKALVHACILNR